MSLAFANTRAILGITAHPISVEVHLSLGMPGFTIVGLPETAVKESRDRVRSAIINSQYEFPVRRITVNLAPAGLPKAGAGFDLAIALGILAASGQIPSENLYGHEYLAELALSGELRGIPTIIPAVLATAKQHHRLIIAESNGQEAALARHPEVYIAATLRDVCEYLSYQTPLKSLPPLPEPPPLTQQMDWSDVKGQMHAKKALEIAACGGHSVLLSGPPGSGKTMLAKRFTTLLPELPESIALECAAIRAIHGKAFDINHWKSPPFRSPHHTASSVALVGGGNPPKPGEISLAHHGVLFLDELPEFTRQVLECLREPLESGNVTISRAGNQMEFPAKFQLIAAMNPCPCGHYGNTEQACNCSPDKIKRYLAKLSGPLLDRIDMHIAVQALPQEILLQKSGSNSKISDEFQAKVISIRELQIMRQNKLNAELSAKVLEEIIALGTEEQHFITQTMTRLKLSARSYHRLLKVALTIADMTNNSQVTLKVLQQAFCYRNTLAPPI